MPLVPDVGHLAERYSGVHFVMFNGPDRILCLAGYAALQNLGARHKMPEDYIQVFRTFRSLIEKQASAKFDRRELEADGSVLLTSNDLRF